MAENRAYKLNTQKQPGSKRGTYIYYYYDSDGYLTSAELSTKLFTKMVKMDRKFYNLERREKDHNVRHLKPSPHRHVFKPQKPEDLPDRKMDESLRSYEESTDLKRLLSQFEGVEKTIFRMYYLERKNQETIAKFLGNTQSYVSKHLQKIKKVIELSDLRRDDQNKR